MATSSVKILSDGDLPELLALLGRNPAGTVMLAARVEQGGLVPGLIGGEVWGHYVDGRLTAALYAGANYLPVNADRASLVAFAALARERGHRPASLVGPADMTISLWRLLEPLWGPAREVRRCQPLMTTGGPVRVPGESALRPAGVHDLGAVLPCAIAMFTEEVGLSPLGSDGGATYRSSVERLIERGRTLILTDNNRVVFKADIGAVSRAACLVQGVWVRPDRRGQGLSTRCMASTVAHALSEHAPLVALYVNDFNLPARAAYRRVGFRDVGTFATVLL